VSVCTSVSIVLGVYMCVYGSVIGSVCDAITLCPSLYKPNPIRIFVSNQGQLSVTL